MEVATPTETSTPMEVATPTETSTPMEVATPTETSTPMEAAAPAQAVIPGRTPASGEAATPAGTFAPTEAATSADTFAPTAAATSAETSAPAEAAVPQEFPTPAEAAVPQEFPTPAEAAVPQEFPTPAEASSRPTFSPDAPLIEGASTTTRGAEASSDHGNISQVAASARPARELPVVARSVDRSIGSEPSRPPRTSESVQPSGPKKAPTTSSAALPVVSRSADRPADSAPLSGFAEAIIKLTGVPEASADAGAVGKSDDHMAVGGDHAASSDDDTTAGYDRAATGDDEAATAEDHTATSDDHEAASALPVTAVPVQRVSTDRQSASGGEAHLPVVANSAAAPAVPDSSLQIAWGQGDAGSASTEDAGQSQIEARLDTPTLGVRLGRAPLTLQPSPLTERVSAPAEPAVQRLEFLTPQLAPTRGARTSSSAQSGAQAPMQTSAPTPAAPMLPATAPTAQRLPSQDGKQVPHSLTKHSLAVSRRETQPEEPQVPATRVEEMQVEAAEVADAVAEATVQRLESLDPAASTQAAAPELTLPSGMHANPGTWGVHSVAVDRPIGPPAVEASTLPAVADLSTGRAVGSAPMAPAVTEFPLGPAVTAEPWTSAPRSFASTPDATSPHSSFPTVSRLAPGAPTYSTSGAAGANRRIAIGPSIPVQRLAALPAPSAGPRSSPLIISRQVAANPASSESRSGGEMSFASMFDSEGRSVTGSPPADGFTSVQLQSADEATPTPLAPAASADTASTPPISPSAVPPTAVDDLEELARQLYEPLSARLKAELWLDRERAGVMSDG
jgi:hypothetical protein